MNYIESKMPLLNSGLFDVLVQVDSLDVSTASTPPGHDFNYESQNGSTLCLYIKGQFYAIKS